MLHAPVTADTRMVIERLFAPEERAGVCTLLETACGSGLPLMSQATPEAIERIRLAALKVSAGSRAGLDRAIALANLDWRDLLLAAGFRSDLRAHRSWFERICAAEISP